MTTPSGIILSIIILALFAIAAISFYWHLNPDGIVPYTLWVLVVVILYILFVTNFCMA